MAITKLVQDFIQIHKFLENSDLYLLNVSLDFNYYSIYTYDSFTSEDIEALFDYFMLEDRIFIIENYLFNNINCPQNIKDKINLIKLLD